MKSPHKLEKELVSRLRLLGSALFCVALGALYYALFDPPNADEIIATAGHQLPPAIDLTENIREKLLWACALFAAIASLCFWVARKNSCKKS